MKKLSSLGISAICAASALSAQVSIQSTDITTSVTWGDDETDVVLDGPIFVKDGAELTILPGTIVRGQPRTDTGVSGAPGSLIISQTGMINAAGTSAEPIIFTTAAVDNDGNGIPDDDDDDGNLDGYVDGDTFYDADPANSPLPPIASGDIPGASGNGLDANNELWGGLVVLGSAPTNLGTTDNATALVGNVEGLPANSDTQYGGTIPNDNSGVLEFVSIRHGGEVLGSANEINGLTLGGVGYGTTMRFIEVYCTWDDGIEWFGGTVNGEYLHVAYAGDDSLDGDQGFTGQIQYAFVVQPYFPIGSSGGDEALEFDGTDSDQNQDGNGDPSPFPGYSVANLTVVGPTGATGFGSGTDVGSKARLTLRNEYSGDIYNAYIVNAPGSAFAVSTPNPVTLDTITVADTADSVAPSGSNIATANFTFSGDGLVGEDQGVAGGLDPRPVSGLGVAGISSNLDLGDQFEDTAFVGAFATSASVDLWTKDWTALNLSGILVD